MSEWLRAHRGIVGLVACFIVLGIWYSATTPLFETPDEQWHFAFVQHVATGRGLPVQSEQPTHLARQEGSQPPLYYWLAAMATFWIDTSDFPAIVWENPHYGYNVPGVVNDNKNLFIHTALESFPYRGAVLAIHIARLVSVAMGALAVLFTYLLALEIFPDRKFLAVCAGAVVAFVPQFVFISGAVSNDSTIVAMAALSLWVMARLVASHRSQVTGPKSQVTGRQSQVSSRYDIALGVTAGLAALAKVSGAGVALLAAFALIYASRDDWRRLVRNLLLFGATIALLAGWWYVRNWILYGELTGTEMMTRIFFARQTPLTLEQLLVQLSEVWETFWVGFGWGNIRAHPVVYTIIEIFVLASVIGLLKFLIFDFRLTIVRTPVNEQSKILLLALWIGAIFIALLRWLMVTQAPHGRLFFPALPALAIMIVYELDQIRVFRFTFHVSCSTLHALPVAFVLFLLTLTVLAPLAIIQPAYAFPPTLSANDVPDTIRRVDINYGDKITLLGYELSSRRVLPGEALTLTLYWQSLAAMEVDYSIGIRLLDASGQVVGARDSYPGHGMLPTRLWASGRIIRDTYWLPIADDAPAPETAQIRVALYTREDKRDLPAFDPNGSAITPFVGRIQIASPNSLPAPHAQNRTDYVFGKRIALIGYDVQLGAPTQLTLYWKRVAPVDLDYTVFVHVLDASGKIVAQKDQMPANGSNPTSLWDDGDVILDRYAIDLAHGAYRIEIGLYRAETGDRLQVADAKGNTMGDHIWLSTVEVAR